MRGSRYPVPNRDIAKETDKQVYPVMTRKMTAEEREKYGLSNQIGLEKK